jgi:hypothetical protein
VLLPAAQFYWAVLDTSKISAMRKRARSRNVQRQLGYLFENVLPVPIEDVQAAYLRLADGRVLACGMDKRVVLELCSGHVHLGPDHAPPHLDEAVEIERINLLTGEFEPKLVRRMKVSWLLQAAAMIALASVLIAVGLNRRAAVCQIAIAGLNDARQQVFKIAGIDPMGTGQPPELRLTAELRRLRQTRQAPAVEVRLTDVTSMLAALLSRWPPSEDAHMQTESISITPTAITLRGIVPASAGAQTVASAINTADEQSNFQFRGWTMAQPQVTNVRDGVQVVLQMTRGEESYP